MKAKTKHLADQITQALGPIFRANPDYKTIIEAMALTVARVAQSTPERFKEYVALDEIMDTATNALTQFLNEEEALLEAKQSTLTKGIDAFTEMARSDGDEEPFNPVCGYVDPSFNSIQEPEFGLAAYNGGASPEARAEAERFAGQDHAEVVEDGPWLDNDWDQWGDGGPMAAKHLDDFKPFHDESGKLTQEGFEQLKKDVITLHTPDPEAVDEYNPDGPRAYTP